MGIKGVDLSFLVAFDPQTVKLLIRHRPQITD